MENTGDCNARLSDRLHHSHVVIFHQARCVPPGSPRFQPLVFAKKFSRSAIAFTCTVRHSPLKLCVNLRLPLAFHWHRLDVEHCLIPDSNNSSHTISYLSIVLDSVPGKFKLILKSKLSRVSCPIYDSIFRSLK